MKIQFETSTGFVTVPAKLGTARVNLRFTFNHRDGYWYLTAPGVVNIRVVNGIIYTNDEGYLKAEGDISKLGFREVTWYAVG